MLSQPWSASAAIKLCHISPLWQIWHRERCQFQSRTRTCLIVYNTDNMHKIAHACNTGEKSTRHCIHGRRLKLQKNRVQKYAVSRYVKRWQLHGEQTVWIRSSVLCKSNHFWHWETWQFFEVIQPLFPMTFLSSHIRHQSYLDSCGIMYGRSVPVWDTWHCTVLQ